MSDKKDKHSNSDDAALFRETVGNVKPISTRTRHPKASKPAGGVKQPSTKLTESFPIQAASPAEMPEIEAGEVLAFHRPDISRNVIRQLRRGKYAIQAEIDLHGLTVSEAQIELRSFITECIDRNLQCIRVVHGKGLRSGDKGPVLKANVNYWLPNWDDVLAFCSALPRHGGTGAIYVLLKTL